MDVRTGWAGSQAGVGCVCNGLGTGISGFDFAATRAVLERTTVLPMSAGALYQSIIQVVNHLSLGTYSWQHLNPSCGTSSSSSIKTHLRLRRMQMFCFSRRIVCCFPLHRPSSTARFPHFRYFSDVFLFHFISAACYALCVACVLCFLCFSIFTYK